MTEQEELAQLRAKLIVATKALHDIKNWNDELEDEWEDQGYRAKDALEKMAILSGF
jgi:hypothetical protein